MILKPKLIKLLMIGCVALWTSCNKPQEPGPVSLSSPDGKVAVTIGLDTTGTAYYTVAYGNEQVIKPSTLGFDFKGVAPLNTGLSMVASKPYSQQQTWAMPWGEQDSVLDHFNGITVQLKEKAEPYRLVNLHFKAYNDGIGFRYEFPKQEGLDTLIVMDENTQFNLTADHTCWWTPGDWDIYEHLYSNTPLSKVNALVYRKHSNLAQSYIPENAMNTPVTMRTASGLHLSFHEANLTNYAGMTLKVDTTSFSMTSGLVGSKRYGYKAKVALPFNTPWRTLQISPDAAGLIASKLILNLNEPNQLGDVSWVKPMKYMGIWWQMHIGTHSWAYEGGKHGATTELAKKYIDFAADNGFGGVLVEGWNTGWENWIGDKTEGIFDFVTSYPDYDLKEVASYAKSKGVALIMHHETSAAVTTYEKHMDNAFALMDSLDIHAVKTGYVNRIYPRGEYHHGQWMVNHYRRVLALGAKHQVAINAHEPIKPTGIRRTYPNAIAREGLRGQEFNAWATDGGNPPSHLPTVAFTRMLAGPIDFTPGVFNIKIDPYKPNNQVNTTLAHQLALYVVIYSPIQMACDIIAHYEGNPAFEFIKEVAVDWSETHVLDGAVGEHVAIARKERGGERWFLGAITNEEGRNLSLSLDFLTQGKKYKAVVYQDGTDAHWNDNPLSIDISEKTFTSEDQFTSALAPGGGVAVVLVPVDE